MTIIIDGQKFACESCIRGHRTSSCTHKDRPLTKIASKGRPRTSCGTCREKRKTQAAVGSCCCNDPRPKAKLRGGIVDPEQDMSRCNCKITGICTCCTVKDKPYDIRESSLLNDSTLPSEYAHLSNDFSGLDLQRFSFNLPSLTATSVDELSPLCDLQELSEAFLPSTVPQHSGHILCHPAASCSAFQKLIPSTHSQPIAREHNYLPLLQVKYEEHLHSIPHSNNKCERFEALMFAVDKALQERDLQAEACCPHPLVEELISLNQSPSNDPTAASATAV
jgi:hypothetical protein